MKCLVLTTSCLVAPLLVLKIFFVLFPTVSVQILGILAILGQMPGHSAGEPLQPQPNVPTADASTRNTQPPTNCWSRGFARPLLFLSLLSVLLPLEGAVLGPSTDVLPVAAAQHYRPAKAVPPRHTSI